MLAQCWHRQICTPIKMTDGGGGGGGGGIVRSTTMGLGVRAWVLGRCKGLLSAVCVCVVLLVDGAPERCGDGDSKRGVGCERCRERNLC